MGRWNVSRGQVVPIVFLGFVLAALSTLDARAARYESFTQKAAKGKKAKVVAATYFGTEGLEEFIGAVRLPNGTIVALGNAWGPTFPSTPTPTVLGKGKHHKLNPWGRDKRKRRKLLEYNPDITGFMAYYSSRLTKLEKLIRFDWGVANFSTVRLSADGKGLLVAGRCSPAFRAWVGSACKTQPSPGGKGVGPFDFQDVKCSGDCFIARLDANTGKAEWAWVLEGWRTPPSQLWVDKEERVYMSARGVTRISADGSKLERISDKGDGKRARVISVDPKDGSFYWGGDRNTSTGREPWRQPYLYKYLDGKKEWTMWEWNSKRVGTNKYRLVSDSSIRSGAISEDGHLYVGGWSDGGNTVFHRQPCDLDKPSPKSRFGMTNYGMKNANSLAWIMKIDLKTKTCVAKELWVTYIPNTFATPRYRGAPNFASIERIQFLDGGAAGFCGRAATGLIQTPNAFYKHPTDGRKFGGKFAAVFNPDFSQLWFSSYWPGCDNLRLTKVKGGVLVTSRSTGKSSGDDGPKSPVHNALQKDIKGEMDGHLVLLELPKP